MKKFSLTTQRPKNRCPRGSGLVESMLCFIVLIPLTLLGADLAVLYNAAQLNEEFAEQLARLCATLPDKTNSIKACQEVIDRYKPPSNISAVQLNSLDFDVGLQVVSVTTSMNVLFPVPLPGHSQQTLTATVKQPILSTPSPG